MLGAAVVAENPKNAPPFASDDVSDAASAS